MIPADREKRRKKNKEKREKDKLAYYDRFGVDPSKATASMLASASRKKKQIKKAEEEFIELLQCSKTLAITAEDFEYCNLSANTIEEVESFSKALKIELKSAEKECKSNIDADNKIRDYMQSCVDGGMLVPKKPRIGVVPKARKYASGKIEMLRIGEPDTDFMMKYMKSDRR